MVGCPKMLLVDDEQALVFRRLQGLSHFLARHAGAFVQQSEGNPLAKTQPVQQALKDGVISAQLPPFGNGFGRRR